MNKKTIFILIIVAVVLLAILVAINLCRYYVFDKISSYLVENKYYGFSLDIPNKWFAEKNTSYSENNIAQLLEDCKNDKSGQVATYEIGKFRFKDQKDVQNLGYLGYAVTGFPTGAILEVVVSCVPDTIKTKILDYYQSNLRVGGEKAIDESLSLSDVIKVKYISFFHDNLQYKVSGYVYMSPNDEKEDQESAWNNYALTFNKIVSSFKFTK